MVPKKKHMLRMCGMKIDENTYYVQKCSYDDFVEHLHTLPLKSHSPLHQTERLDTVFHNFPRKNFVFNDFNFTHGVTYFYKDKICFMQYLLHNLLFMQKMLKFDKDMKYVPLGLSTIGSL